LFCIEMTHPTIKVQAQDIAVLRLHLIHR
jgi:hypothetical protein